VTAVLGVGLQLAAAAVLLVAGAQKLASPRRFAETLQALRLPGVAGLARAIPLLELVTAVLLLTGVSRVAAAALTSALGLGFGAAGLMAMRSRARIACACFGPLDSGTLGLRHVAVVPVWLLVAVGMLYLPTISGMTGVVALVAIAQAAGLVAAAYLIAPHVRARRLARVVTP
jgi:hypothetical protein